jgi:hypothetical protein
LLNDPSAGGMPRDIEVQDAAKIMADDKEAVEDADVQRWDRKEVHRSDCFTMIGQERKPAFCGSGPLGALRIQREMVRSETSKPSMRSSP